MQAKITRLGCFLLESNDLTYSAASSSVLPLPEALLPVQDFSLPTNPQATSMLQIRVL